MDQKQYLEQLMQEIRSLKVELQRIRSLANKK